MPTFAPGDTVVVTGINGGDRATVIEDRGDRVLVRIANKRREVRASRVHQLLAASPPPGPVTRSPSYERPKARAVPKDAPTRSRAYLDHVRAQPCMHCLAPAPSDAHHWSLRGKRGMGIKADDHRTVPLCRRCHDEYHATGALPDATILTTRMSFLAKQVDLLVGWIKEREAQ